MRSPGSSEFVVHASPLILLSRVGQLDLLDAVATRVLLPRAVLTGIEGGAAKDTTHAAGLAHKSWTVLPDLTIPDAIRDCDSGAGEGQVLAHCLDRSSRLAVLDALAARRCAASLGITMMGTLGIVVEARRRGRPQRTRPVIDSLLENGLRAQRSLVEALLVELGE